MLTKSNLQKVGLVFATVLLLWSVIFSTVRAETRQSEKINVTQGETINDDLFATGAEINIDGTVNGDVYAGGRALVVSGEINGDLIVGAETITVTGTINDDIRAAGRLLVIDNGAVVADGVMFFGDTLEIKEGAEVADGVLFFGKNLVIDGTVNGIVRGVMEKIVISGQVERGVYIDTKITTIRDGAVIGGDLDYKSNNEADISDGATISGEVLKSTPVVRGSDYSPNISYNIWLFLATLLIGLVFLWILPRPTVALGVRITDRPLRTFVVGLLMILAFLPVSVLLMITVIGMPLSIILFVTFIAALFFAKIFPAIAIGTLILKKSSPDKPHVSPYLSLALGILIITVLSLTPFVGGFIGILATALGLGAMFYGIQRARLI